MATRKPRSNSYGATVAREARRPITLSHVVVVRGEDGLYIAGSKGPNKGCTLRDHRKSTRGANKRALAIAEHLRNY